MQGFIGGDFRFLVKAHGELTILLISLTARASCVAWNPVVNIDVMSVSSPTLELKSTPFT